MVSTADKKTIKNVITKLGRILNTDMPKIEDVQLREMLTVVFMDADMILSSVVGSQEENNE